MNKRIITLTASLIIATVTTACAQKKGLDAVPVGAASKGSDQKESIKTYIARSGPPAC